MDEDDERDLRFRSRDVQVQLLTNVSVRHIREIAVRNCAGRQRPVLSARWLSSRLASAGAGAALFQPSSLRLHTPGGHHQHERQR
jgi:hypothetical protein